MAEWRFIVTRLVGDGTEEVVDFDLLGVDPSFTEVLNGGTEAEIKLRPELAYLIDARQQFALRPWGNAVYFERDGGADLVGGIYVDHQIDPEDASITLELSGFANYPGEMPYTSSYTATEIDPLDVFRHIWDHLQAQPGGNLGVVVDPLKSGKKIGRLVAQGEFDTENGPLAFEYEPVALHWYSTHDLGSEIASLSENTPFDFVERHRWNADRTAIEHRIELGYPQIGTQRDDVRFVVDENITMPAVEAMELEYASEVLALGAGEGSAMLRASVNRSGEDRIRRVAVVEQKDANTPQAINAVAQAEIRQRSGGDRVVEVVAAPWADDLHSVQVGDFVPLIGTLADPTSTTFGPSDVVKTLDLRVASFNLRGADDASWMSRRPGLVSTMQASGADVFILQELIKSRVDGLLGALRTATGRAYVSIPGMSVGGIFIDAAKASAVTPIQIVKTSTDSQARPLQHLKIEHLDSGLQIALWSAHFRGSGETNERIREARKTIPVVLAQGPSIGGGDLNTDSTAKTGDHPMAQFRQAGIVDMRDATDSITNRQYNSFDGFDPNPMNGLWIDHLFGNGGPVPSIGGLIDSGSASDHNLIWADYSWSQTTSETVEIGTHHWVRVLSKTTSPANGTVSFEVAAPGTL